MGMFATNIIVPTVPEIRPLKRYCKPNFDVDKNKKRPIELPIGKSLYNFMTLPGHKMSSIKAVIPGKSMQCNRAPKS